MTRPIKMLWATLALGAGLGASGAAYAVNEATLNQCWGQTTKEFAQLDNGQGVGDHSSAHSGVTPTPTALGGEDEPPLGRRGVGNVSKEDFDDDGDIDLSDGAQGVHAIEVGAQMGLPACNGPHAADVP